MPDWRDDIFAALKAAEIRQVGYVPDAGHTRLIELCQADPEIRAIVLTSEEEGIGLAAGATSSRPLWHRALRPRAEPRARGLRRPATGDVARCEGVVREAGGRGRGHLVRPAVRALARRDDRHGADRLRRRADAPAGPHRRRGSHRWPPPAHRRPTASCRPSIGPGRDPETLEIPATPSHGTCLRPCWRALART